jgi:hypothetical protein
MPARQQGQNRAAGLSKVFCLQPDHLFWVREALDDLVHQPGPPQVSIMGGHRVQDDGTVRLQDGTEFRAGTHRALQQIDTALV